MVVPATMSTHAAWMSPSSGPTTTFLARFVPNRRRHDRAALAAYEAYKHSLAQGSANSIGPKVAA